MGGDIQGITAQIKEGYFTDLGVNAIWFTPVVEQITGSVDEGTGNSFGFHGYWTRDWTAIYPKFGTKADLAELVSVAHDHEIRILIDVVANHTGPVTPLDVLWPDTWVKTGPQCTYKSSETTINCTLVKNLPDIRTEIDEEVELPQFLIDKWKAGGRYEAEVLELKEWFETTG
jgi:alpha-amylase